ncbi:Plasmodium vivax Vir protein, putative [Plasmodium vivax]|nr:Plasmodium vivax Vir protein, putative [Plasmodium vivax]
MDDSIYNLAHQNYNYESLFTLRTGANESQYETRCRNIKSGNTTENSFDIHCKKCMTYLDKLDELDELEGGRSTGNKVIQGCIYLYFWIYENLLDKSLYNNNNFDIYKKFLEEYNTYKMFSNINQICSGYNKDELNGKLKDLYYLYYKFYKLKNDNECTSMKCNCAENCFTLYMECNNSCDKDINGISCEKLEKFRLQYNEYMKTNVNCDRKYTYLPSAIKFDRKAFLISVLVILVISFTLFGLYKFTPLGSRMCPRNKKKKKMWNRVDEEIYDTKNALEMSDGNSKERPYNLGYHFMEQSL